MTRPPVNPQRRPAPATPRWVKLFVAVFMIIVLVVIAVHLVGVDFGHMRHMR